jgi:hypothetical protein
MILRRDEQNGGLTLVILENWVDLAESAAPFLCLIFDHYSRRKCNKGQLDRFYRVDDESRLTRLCPEHRAPL